MISQLPNIGKTVAKIEKGVNMTALAKQPDFSIIEDAIVKGDLAKLSPQERLNYYQSLCKSLGLNPLSKPFEYITLNGKLTLYARKDATDQLRKINGVSIEDVDIKETDSQFIVKVKGRDKTGRSDVDLGVVNKNDMRGDTANAMMKAVTKGKRRLTLSLCGLGVLDETEVETIPDAKPFVERLEEKTSEAITNPVAKSLAELVTAKQLGMIRAICRELNIEPDAECQTVFSCKTDELSKNAASALIQHLQDLQKGQLEPNFIDAESPEVSAQMERGLSEEIVETLLAELCGDDQDKRKKFLKGRVPSMMTDEALLKLIDELQETPF